VKKIKMVYIITKKCLQKIELSFILMVYIKTYGVVLTFEIINETVQVITFFDGKRIRPLRFLWRDRTYRVKTVHSAWHDVVGRNREYHFYVATKESGSFELVYNTGGLLWKIGRVCVDE